MAVGKRTKTGLSHRHLSFLDARSRTSSGGKEGSTCSLEAGLFLIFLRFQPQIALKLFLFLDFSKQCISCQEQNIVLLSGSK